VANITDLEIETHRLQGDIDSLTGELNALRSTGKEMMAGVDALSSMWEGQAKEAFTAQFRSDYETLNSMADVIQELIKCLENARSQYDACEQKVGSIINAIRV